MADLSALEWLEIEHRRGGGPAEHDRRRCPFCKPGARDWEAEREVAYRLSATLQEAALAGITLDGRARRDLARLIPGYEVVARSSFVRDGHVGTLHWFSAACPECMRRRRAEPPELVDDAAIAAPEARSIDEDHPGACGNCPHPAHGEWCSRADWCRCPGSMAGLEALRAAVEHWVPQHASSCANQDDDAECTCGTSEVYRAALALASDVVSALPGDRDAQVERIAAKLREHEDCRHPGAYPHLGQDNDIRAFADWLHDAGLRVGAESVSAEYGAAAIPGANPVAQPVPTPEPPTSMALAFEATRMLIDNAAAPPSSDAGSPIDVEP